MNIHNLRGNKNVDFYATPNFMNIWYPGKMSDRRSFQVCSWEMRQRYLIKVRRLGYLTSLVILSFQHLFLPFYMRVFVIYSLTLLSLRRLLDVLNSVLLFAINIIYIMEEHINYFRISSLKKSHFQEDIKWKT